jgi:hypothetical protein
MTLLSHFLEGQISVFLDKVLIQQSRQFLRGGFVGRNGNA